MLRIYIYNDRKVETSVLSKRIKYYLWKRKVKKKFFLLTVIISADSSQKWPASSAYVHVTRFIKRVEMIPPSKEQDTLRWPILLLLQLQLWIRLWTFCVLHPTEYQQIGLDSQYSRADDILFRTSRSSGQSRFHRISYWPWLLWTRWDTLIFI